MALFSLEIIGTHLEIRLEKEGDFDDLFQSIEKRLHDFEQKYSRFIEGNWLDKLNKERKGYLDTDGIRMLDVALEIAEISDGYFDPTIGSTLSDLGYGRSDHRGKEIGWKKIRKWEAGYIELMGEVILEFWWVGKGYLIDIIRTLIDEYFEDHSIDIERYLINFGGDMYGKGAWKIGLEHPEDHKTIIGTIILDNLYLACSAGGKRKWWNHHHLIDPKTGTSAQSVIATYIEGENGIYTDALATTLAVMPYQMSCNLLNSRYLEEGIIVEQSGKYFQSEKSKSILFI